MNLTLYSFMKFLHVLLAVVAVGFNASYGIWLARVAKEPEHAPHVLRGIQFLDDRIANPAYGLLLVLGLAMVWESGIPFSTFWIAASLVLYVVMVVLAVAGFTPAFASKSLLPKPDAWIPMSTGRWRNEARPSARSSPCWSWSSFSSWSRSRLSEVNLASESAD